MPPPTLDSLVPAYVPRGPDTGMRAHLRYEYAVGGAAAEYRNPWALVVPCPYGLPNADQFLYFPKQNYPSAGCCGILERVRDWAYAWE